MLYLMYVRRVTDIGCVCKNTTEKKSNAYFSRLALRSWAILHKFIIVIIITYKIYMTYGFYWQRSGPYYGCTGAALVNGMLLCKLPQEVAPYYSALTR